MHRVVTKTMVTRNGIRKRQIDLGPWQPSEQDARRWVGILEATGLYDTVTLQSNGQGNISEQASLDVNDEGLVV